MQRVLGAVLLAIPLGTMLGVTLALIGPAATLGICAFSLTGTAMIVGGVYLLVTNGEPLSQTERGE